MHPTDQLYMIMPLSLWYNQGTLPQFGVSWDWKNSEKTVKNFWGITF